MVNSLKTRVALLIFVALSALAFALFAPVSPYAKAESATDAALKPIEIDSDVKYRYFACPTAVHADANGIYVTDSGEVVTVSPDMSFSSRALASQKTYHYGECFISLHAGVISVNYGATQTDFSSALYYDDFDLFDDRIYAVADGKLTVIPLDGTDFDNAHVKTLSLVSDTHADIDVSAIAVCDGYVYVALGSAAFSGKSDIATVNMTTGRLTTVFPQSDVIFSMTVMAHTGTVYALTRDCITAYKRAGGGLVPAYPAAMDARMTALYAYDGYIYAVDTLNALYRISQDLGTFTVIAASADGSDGFYNMPADIAVKNSTLYAADYKGDRVAIYGDTLSYIDGSYKNPAAITCDSGSAVYIAHDFNKITVTDGGDAKAVPYAGGIVKQLEINTDKRLFILANDGLYRYDRGAEACEKLSDTPYKAITVSIGHDELYALDYDKVVKITFDAAGNASEKAVCNVDPASFSLGVDLRNNIYLLTRTDIVRVENASGRIDTFALTLDGAPYTLGFSSGRLILSTVGNKFVGYGDAIIADTYKHRLFTADGSANGLNIKLIDDDYEVPDVKDDTSPAAANDRLIRVALYDTPVFSLPMETPAVYTIAEGRKVIVPQYDLEDTKEYSLILIDNITTGELLQGYVYKDSLSDPLPYVDPPADIGKVYSGATPVYKWPSPNSKAIAGYAATDRGTEFDILKFVESYHDDYNNLWYRVSLGDGKEGYMLAVNFSLMAYEPVYIRPAYDAKIIPYKGSEYAQVYKLVDGKYEATDISLRAGTKVEIVGAYDTSERYTKVKYLDSKLGTLTGYVETGYLEYEGTNVVLIVAIVVIIITLVLAAIIIGRVIYIKHKRLVAPPNDTTNTDRL